MKKIKDVLKIIFLTLAILTMMVSLWGKAKAAEPISPYEIQYLEDLMQTWNTEPDNTPVDFTSLYSQFESDCITNPYYVTNNSNYIIMCKKPSFGLVSVYDSSYNPKEPAFNVSEYPNWQDSFPFIMYQSYTPSSGWRVVIRFEVTDFNGGKTVEPMRFSWTGNVASSKTDYTRITYYNSTQFSVSNTNWYGNVDSFYRCNGSQGTGYSNGWSVTELSVTPIQIPSDDRFSIYTTIDNIGMPYLHVDWDESVYPYNEAYNYDSSTIELTIDCEGTSSIYSFNSEDYPALFPTSGSTYIPYQFLDSVNHILENQLPLSAVLTHVRLVQYAYPSSAGSQAMQTFSAETDCDVTLIGEDGTIPDFDELDVQYVDNHISSEDFHTLSLSGNNSILDNSIVNADLSQVEWLINQYMASLDEDWADVCIAYDYGEDYFTSSDLTLIKDLVDAVGSNFGNVGSVISYLFNVYLDHQNTQYAGTYYHVIDDILYNNAYTQSYDYIIAVNFYNLSSSDAYFDVYIIRTSRYWQHKALMSFNNIQTLLGNINDFTVNTYDLLYNGLYNIADNNKVYFESALSNDNIIIRYLKSINTNLNNLNSAINYGFKDALSRLDYLYVLDDLDEYFTSVNRSIDAVPEYVGYEIRRLFMPSYDSIAVNFNDYKDSLGVLALPFDASVTVLDAVDDNYSSVFSIDVPAIEFDNHTFYNGTTFTLDVWGYFDDETLSSDAPSGKSFTMGIKYLIAYSAILGCAFFTYCHIFRRFGEENEE